VRACADGGPSVLVGQRGAAAEHGKVDLRRVGGRPGQRHPVLARREQQRAAGQGIDSILDVAGRAGDGHANASFEESHQRGIKEVDRRELIDGHGTAVGEQDLDTAAIRAEPVSSQQDEIWFGLLHQAIAFERRCALHDRQVRGYLVRPCGLGLNLAGRGRRQETQGDRAEHGSLYGHWAMERPDLVIGFHDGNLSQAGWRLLPLYQPSSRATQALMSPPPGR
jgi:hypothetical protein